MKIGKRILLMLAALVTVALPAAEKNIVFVIADDLSPTLGCYGDMTAVTPNIDRLAADGTLFRYAFATTASCSASRSVILSGLHNHRNGHYGHLHAYHKFSSFPWVQTLPVLLAKAGYRTARVGKHHNGPEDIYFFETKINANSRSTVEMANSCEAFIKADDNKPFFLYYATSDPHRGGGDANELPHKPNRFGNKPNKGAYPGVKEVFYDPAKVTVPPFLPDTPETRAELAQYYQSTSRVDQGLGRLMEILKKNGKWENTIIIFTSDHGMAFAGGKTTVYEGGLRVPFIVRNPYQKERGNTNNAMLSFVDIVPTLLDFAGGYDAKTGAAKPELAMMPAGRGTKKGPYKFHGRSFLPILADKNPKDWDQVNASHTFHEIQMYYPMRVVRDRKYKLIWNIAHPLPYPFASDLWAAPSWQAQWKKGQSAPYGKKTVREYINRPQFELFDISADPNEAVNLATDAKYAKVLEEYKAKLKKFQQDTQDPWVLKWRYE
ncbi:MAG: sulfatase [Verrucomicrobia subdivision 3 bacterium]|nr:sulfatase [Limisphaerales bacterium]